MPGRIDLSLHIQQTNLVIRQDIQTLHGLAVLFVLMFHADVPLFEHGYLDVNIFFVISGYLITTQIVNGMEQGRIRSIKV